ncbi:MAG: DUF485 domain-containing protein [Anaerolineae bacterium]|nr:DUF485 domain-containing protein [Anaerolineae bacterium]
MLHEPAVSSDVDPAIGYKMRVGVRMFLFYALVYGGFVTINVVNPLAMESTVLLGLNLAVVYGIGLIALAFLLAIIYTRLCARKEQEC